MGMDLSYPPFETIDENGQPHGVSVELAQALADSLHKKLRIENIPFTGLIPSLQNGRVDCVISSMTDTTERRRSVDFSKAYLSTGLAILLPKNSAVTSIRDLDQPDRKVVVRQGTTGELWARDRLKSARVIAVEKENSAVLEVVEGKVDAFIYDQMSIWRNGEMNPGTTRTLLAPLTVESWAIAFRKGNDSLRESANAFLEQFRKDGGFERLGDKYLREQKEAFRREGIPFVF